MTADQPRGAIALHGGGEFLPGDEPFLEALLDAAPDRAEALRISIVPAATAAYSPRASGSMGVAAFERVAAAAARRVAASAVLVVDTASAQDPALAEQLRRSDIVFLPGGDPAAVPAILAGSPAWAAILKAHDAGAVVGGASAGAMGLAGRTWAPGAGWRDGLGLVEGLIVVPHFEHFDVRGYASEVQRLDEEGLARVGLDERTGIIRTGDGTWRVAGAGAAHWFAVGAPAAITARHGETLPITT